jgi:tetratricopeptide (TPR) repeat protein
MRSPPDRRAFSGTGAPFRGTEPGEVAAALAEAQDLIDLGITTEGAKRARFVLAADGAHPAARGLIARALQLDGQHDLAANLLVSQLELNPITADAFYQVAMASFNAGFAANALDAIKAALGLDAQHLDSLLLLARFDNADLAEIAAVLTKIAPDDPRVQQFLSDRNVTGAVKS